MKRDREIDMGKSKSKRGGHKETRTHLPVAPTLGKRQKARLPEVATTAHDAPEVERPQKMISSPYGPCVSNIRTMVNDEWQTTLEGWAPLEPIFRKYKLRRIWQPFYYDGMCAEHLRELGFEHVHHKPNEDFFLKIKDTKFLHAVDLIWDNPPYTSPETKERVLRGLLETSKPFCMLLPLATVHAQFVRDICDMTSVQLIIPRKVMVKKRTQEALPFKYHRGIFHCGLGGREGPCGRAKEESGSVGMAIVVPSEGAPVVCRGWHAVS